MFFDISSEPEECQRRQQEILEGLENVADVADDIYICGCFETVQEAMCNHDKALTQVSDRCSAHNLKLNKKKTATSEDRSMLQGEVLSVNGSRQILPKYRQ